MGGEKPRAQAAAQVPVIAPPDPKQKKNRGAYFGVGEVPYGTIDQQSRRGVFLGG